MNKEEWDAFPQYKNKNFKCYLIDSGLWRLENPPIHGKTLFIIEKIGTKSAPTFADQRNFFSGLFEAEWRNDNFIFPNGTTRNPQREKKIDMFKQIIEDISNRADIKDTKKAITYYIKKFQREDERDTD